MAITPTQNLKTRSGNRIVITYGGVQIGLIQSVRSNDDYGHEGASGIGDIHVQEHVPSMARHSISVSEMVLNTGSMRSAGISMENGDAVLQGLVFDISTYSKDDGTLLRKYLGCTYTSGDVEISKHAIVVSNAQFLALDVVGTGV